MVAHVLVVEPSSAAEGPLARAVAEIGYQVRTAHGPGKALDAARGWAQLVVIDVGPEGDSAAPLVARLKAESPDTEIVLVADGPDTADAAESASPEAWEAMARPFHPQHLISVLDRALRQVLMQQEKNELMRRAQVAEKLATVGRLTAGLSHEIRNPLNAASLQLEVVARRVRRLDASLQGPLLEPLTLVRGEIDRLGHIVSDFLHFARPTPLVIQPTPMGPIVDRVVALMSTDAERRGVALKSKTSPGLVVPGDADQLQQVLLNLTLNGLDATPRLGEVVLTVEPSATRPGWAEVHVDDSGPGVPAEMAERIFEPFFTTKASGSGLGLSITAAIVSQHNGTIRVDRSTLGGARFTLLLPRAAAGPR